MKEAVLDLRQEMRTLLTETSWRLAAMVAKGFHWF